MRTEIFHDTSNGLCSLQSIQERHAPVALFGASSRGLMAIAFLKRRGIPLLAFYDNDPKKWGTRVEGLLVNPPSDLTLLNRDFPVIITSFAQKEIFAQLSDLQFTNILWFNEVGPSLIRLPAKDHVHSNRSGELGNNCADYSPEVIKAMSLLADERSREVMRGLLRFRISGNTAILKSVSTDVARQYVDPDVVSFGNEEVFVDGGAFWGDSMLHFCRAVAWQFKRAYLFEPSPANFERLLQTIRENGLENRVEAHPLGLHSHSTELHFHADPEFVGGSADHVDHDNGSLSIRGVALDDVLGNKPVTFIKLDIEGSEMDAITGMRKTLSTFRPKLAVAVYHRPDDLWQIILAIQALAPDYRFFLRHHHEDAPYETLLYAIPQEECNPASFAHKVCTE